ncbi:bacillithiol system redox-active protein YtxJ [Nemorincola caseinilytica]|uniref:Bacillithiol system redox-active protein YtxJ n=1 Tax=Nemorincola caseinilytica TaxID=2054315 RepID=A0ABP8NIX7_9BACT
MMNWTELTTEAQEESIKTLSASKPVLVFKHSSRCSISNMAMARLEQLNDNDTAAFFIIDVLRDRPISMKIAEQYQVHHESPQALLIVNGECVYDESHNGITAKEIVDEINEWRSKMAAQA